MYLSPISTSSTYLVHTIFSQYVLGTYSYVLCLQNHCRGSCFMWYACEKRYCVCMACMLWCSNTKSVPLRVSNIHDTILVRTKYVLVCTGLYYHTFSVPVCIWYVLRTYRYVLNTLFLYDGSGFQMMLKFSRLRIRLLLRVRHGGSLNVS